MIKTYELMRRLILQGEQYPFNLDKTLSCGQVFQWKKEKEQWTGIINGNICSVVQKNDHLLYDGITREEIIRYFNLNLNLTKVIDTIRDAISQSRKEEVDSLFETAVLAGNGLRIIKQDPWECLISFICSQNSNIPAITKRIRLLSQRYGSPLSSGQYRFPSPNDLLYITPGEMRDCSTGYRAPYLIAAAEYIYNNPNFLQNLNHCSTREARKNLMKLPGVGPKVADCVLLFAYNFYDSVPVDVWIRKIITNGYLNYGNRTGGRKNYSYEQIADFCRSYFGGYGGYAQQYLFAGRYEISRILELHPQRGSRR